MATFTPAPCDVCGSTAACEHTTPEALPIGPAWGDDWLTPAELKALRK